MFVRRTVFLASIYALQLAGCSASSAPEPEVRARPNFKSLGVVATTGVASAPASIAPQSSGDSAARGSNAGMQPLETTSGTAYEILQAPSSFEVKVQTPYAWERAQLFFERYTSNYSIEATGGGAESNSLRISNRSASQDSTIYEVLKRSLAQGNDHYTVSAHSRTPGAEHPTNLKMKAQNLARFIRDGSIELTLVPQKPR